MFEFLLHIDYRLFQLINFEMSSTWGDGFFPWITDLHKTKYFGYIAIPMFLFIFVKKFKRIGISYFLFLILALSVSDFVGAKVKRSFERPRPSENLEIKVVQRTKAGHFSFYSNHTSNMFTFASYTGSLIPQLRAPLLLIAATVGYSRIYNGVHYPSDVFFGAIAGLIWGPLFAFLSRKLNEFLQKRKQVN
jgi:undecaprenyl-diphosphatase